MPAMDEFRKERESIKNAPFKKKWEYFWDYYKIHVIVTVAVLAMVISYIHSVVTDKNDALYVAMINAYAYDDDMLSNDYLKHYNIDPKENEVIFDTSYSVATSATETVTEAQMYSGQKLMAVFSAGELDVLVGSVDNIESYAYEACLYDLRVVFTPEELEALSPYLYYVDEAVIDALEAAEDSGDYNAEIATPNPTDPSSMEKPIPVGVYMDSSTIFGTYFYVTNTDTRPGNGIVAGIGLSSKNVENSANFIRYMMNLE